MIAYLIVKKQIFKFWYSFLRNGNLVLTRIKYEVWSHDIALLLSFKIYQAWSQEINWKSGWSKVTDNTEHTHTETMDSLECTWNQMKVIECD